jgi:hypothetical protein
MKRAPFIVVLLFVLLAFQSVTTAAQPSRQLNDSSASSSSSADAGLEVESEFWPYLHAPLQEVIQVAAGSRHACALTTAGSVLCWGRNQFGQLGDGTRINRTTPVPVTGLSTGVRAIAGAGNAYQGDQTCALNESGAVLCWGGSGAGQVGDGSVSARLTPSPVGGLASGIRSISTGPGSSCAVTTAGGLLCWGIKTLGNRSLMTPADFLVSCFKLVPTHTGNGSDPAPYTTRSIGCAAAGYVVGERVTMTANPAFGWRVAGWSGTEDDASTSSTNTVKVQFSEASVGVRYLPGATRRPVFLPFLLKRP